MKKLIFLTILSVLIFIGCENTCNVTEPGSDGVELEWIIGGSDNDELYYTNDDQITITDTINNNICYGIKEMFDLGIPSVHSYGGNLVKCDKIELFVFGSQDSFFSYSKDILPDVVYTRTVNLYQWEWKEK